jgi:hypothetical protein
VESTFKYISAPIININYSRKCSGQFHVAEWERKDGSDIRTSDKEGGGDDTTDEEIISPASYVATFSRAKIRIIIYAIVVQETALHQRHLPPRNGNYQIVVAAGTTRMWHMTRVAQMTVMAHNSSVVSISSACKTTV